MPCDEGVRAWRGLTTCGHQSRWALAAKPSPHLGWGGSLRVGRSRRADTNSAVQDRLLAIKPVTSAALCCVIFRGCSVPPRTLPVSHYARTPLARLSWLPPNGVSVRFRLSGWGGDTHMWSEGFGPDTAGPKDRRDPLPDGRNLRLGRSEQVQAEKWQRVATAGIGGMRLVSPEPVDSLEDPVRNRPDRKQSRPSSASRPSAT